MGAWFFIAFVQSCKAIIADFFSCVNSLTDFFSYFRERNFSSLFVDYVGDIDMGIVSNTLDKILGRFNLSWSGSYDDYYESLRKNNDFVPAAQKNKKIPILINSRCEKENLSKQEWIQKSRDIESQMLNFICLPYQTITCSYIGENKAWTSYNWNNKNMLRIANMVYSQKSIFLFLAELFLYRQLELTEKMENYSNYMIVFGYLRITKIFQISRIIKGG